MKRAVSFEPWGTAVEIEHGKTLLDAAQAAGVPIGAVCGGRGTCGKCRVRILSGSTPPATEAEKDILSPSALQRAERLACRTPVTDPVTVEILQISAQGKREAAAPEYPTPAAPVIQRRTVSVPPPTLEDPVDDDANLRAALGRAGGAEIPSIDYHVAQALPTLLRAAGWHVTTSIRSGEVISVQPAHGARSSLGLAVDLGTTTIAAYLHRLDDGEPLSVSTAANPLSTYGADIITRMTYAMRAPGNGPQLQRVLLKAVSALAGNAAEEQGCAREDIEEIVAVGNSGMHHLFLDLPGRYLMSAPFVPALRGAISIKARELGLPISPGAYVYLPPLVGGFIGSDLLAVALSVRLDRKPGVRLAMDIGTNTELLLSVDGRLTSCSTASGPALEGAALKYGTMAMNGAIDRVQATKPGAPFLFHTIGDRAAVGICGSGIIDLLAGMHRLGVIDHTGRLQVGFPGVIADPGGNHRYVVMDAADTALGVDLTISQTEIRAIQLAKGAIRAGIDTLLAEQGIDPERIDEVSIAGAFGGHIDVQSVLAIGLLPPVPRDRIRQIGNAAGVGAGLILVSEEERRAAAELSVAIGYRELARQEGFLHRFARSQWLPRETE
ncbi:MAG TPA: ASKHA domain-containing protein [Spirochaetia bacterium]|nr:ASKHA domain-containing protein [Spirochaetia bacterium]